MNSHIEILFRSVLAMLLLLLIAKILGKQTISNMTFHDFVTGITLGALASNLAFNREIGSSYLLLAFLIMTLTSFILSVIAMKNRKMRNWISGSPTVLIEDGKILENNMKKVRYTLDSLDQALRAKDIFNLEEVDYAVLEDNGMLSVLRRDEYRPITKKDMQIPTSAQSFPIELIMDGTVIHKNLKNNGLTHEWIEAELRRRGKRLSDVFYGVKGTQDQLIFDYYKDDIPQPIDAE